MNYYQARQLKDSGKWHWTRMNDKIIYPAGDCVNHEGHNTKEEAERCFYEYEIKKLYETSFSMRDKCSVKSCKAFTDKALTPDGYSIAHLCKKHRNIKTYRKLFPFKPGRQIISSS